MKKILITGVSGFVGSHLAKALLSRGYVVKGMDNLSQGAQRNMDSFIHHPHFSFHKGDVCDFETVEKLALDVDGIAHLAAFKIPRYGGASKTLLINTKGTENILEIGRKNKTRIVFSSTSDVYGKNPNVPFHENSDLLMGHTKIGRWAYAVSKIYDEHLCLAYKEEYAVPISIVRYFGGYGPHQHLTWWGGPQSVFIDCALKGKAIPIHGDGKQTRSFTYISDLVLGTIAALEKEEAIGEVFNIGNDREISIVELASMIWKMIRKEDPIFEFISYGNFSRQYEDVMRRIPDISKSQKILNFVAKTSLEEGLPQTIEWQKQWCI